MRGSASRGIKQGFTHVHPSGLPLACAPGWDGRASAFAPSSAPRSYPRCTSGRGLTLNTGQELCHRHHRPSNRKLTHSMRPCVAQLLPVHSGIQHQPHSPSPAAPLAPASGELPRSNGSVLTPPGRARHPISGPASPANQSGHGLDLSLRQPRRVAVRRQLRGLSRRRLSP